MSAVVCAMTSMSGMVIHLVHGMIQPSLLRVLVFLLFHMLRVVLHIMLIMSIHYLPLEKPDNDNNRETRIEHYLPVFENYPTFSHIVGRQIYLVNIIKLSSG